MKIRDAILATLAAIGASAHATVINFDELSIPPCCSYPTQGYEGFNWAGGGSTFSWVLSTTDNVRFPGSAAHSGKNFAWSNGTSSLDLTLQSGGEFDFNSMWTRSGYNYMKVTVTGYANNAIVGTTTYDSTTDYSFETFDFKGIDDLQITTEYGNLLIDDMNVTTSATAVPEPTNIAMFLAGLGLTAALVRRRTKTPE